MKRPTQATCLWPQIDAWLLCPPCTDVCLLLVSVQIDAGKMIVAPKVEVGYLAQTAVSGSQNTVYQEARSQMLRLLQASCSLSLSWGCHDANLCCGLDQLWPFQARPVLTSSGQFRSVQASSIQASSDQLRPVQASLGQFRPVQYRPVQSVLPWQLTADGVHARSHEAAPSANGVKGPS